jgi:subtilisin family serine protease
MRKTSLSISSFLACSNADSKRDQLYDEVLYAATNAQVIQVAPAGDNATDTLQYPAANKGTIGVTDQVLATSNEQNLHTSSAETTPVSETPATETPATETPAADNLEVLRQMGWTEDVAAFSSKLNQKVRVALISTGIDYDNPDFKDAITDNLLGTTWHTELPGDFPRDEDGFGTRIASLLVHKRLGFARSFIDLIPIKVTSSLREPVSAGDLIRGIYLAVNKGVEVIILPHDYDGSCNPGVGHAIFKAIEKGVTFVLASGDSLKIRNKTGSGIPIVAESDYGPAQYGQTTSNPACWGRYFLGATAVAASEGFTKPLPIFSNYGDDIELSASGTGLTTIGLNNTQIINAKGSAFSAAWGAAAAALAIAHHKNQKFKYAPYYLWLSTGTVI